MRTLAGIGCMMIMMASVALAADDAGTVIDQLVIADFDSGEKPNNIGGDFGTWNYNPDDDSQSCVMDFALRRTRIDGTADNCLKLTYDVQSPNPAFNGLWMKLEGTDASNFNRLRFWVKGDEQTHFTARFKVELKNALGKRAIYMIKGITAEWSEVLIDFKKTSAITDWTSLSELTIVFSDLVATYKEGTILIDDIEFVTIEEPATALEEGTTPPAVP